MAVNYLWEEGPKWSISKALRSAIHHLPDIKAKPGVVLKDFQRRAVAFLLKCREKYRFALLADEMGVGKVCLNIYTADCQTIQTLACMCAINQLFQNAPVDDNDSPKQRSIHIVFTYCLPPPQLLLAASICPHLPPSTTFMAVSLDGHLPPVCS